MTMAADRTHFGLAGYYGSPVVRQRIAEFCGAREPGGPLSALDLAGYGGTRWLREPEGGAVRRPLSSLSSLAEQGADVCRSLADTEGTLLLLDLGYAHPSDPNEPYRDPAGCFGRLEPVHREVLAAFARRGVAPLVLMTGRGYQYLMRAAAGGSFQAGLVRLGARPERLALDMERAHEGAGRLLEVLVHEVLCAAAPRTDAALRLADVPPVGGGPFVCLDLSAYSDPLSYRHLRCAFSSNQKALITRPGCASPFVVVLPCGERPFRELLPLRSDLLAAERLAEQQCAAIPDVTDAEAWLREYAGSGLAFFHAEFDAAPAAAWSRGPEDPFDPDALPPCAGLPLRFPNPWLLQPRHLRTVALVLWSMGWHPRSIAALVQSRYEQDHDWGTLWQRHDAASRAEFHARLFCGAAAEGLEDGTFSCDTLAQKGLCRTEGCGYDLAPLLRRLRRQRARDQAHA